MNPYDPVVVADWGDDTYRFRLGIDQMLELEAKCDAGLYAIYSRVVGRAWKVNDIRETVRLGLIGGGKSPTDALKLTRLYVDQRPLLESWPLVLAVLDRCLTPPDGLKKKARAGAAKPSPEATGSTPEPSTETGP